MTTARFDEDEFRLTIQRLTMVIHQNAADHGFWEGKRNEGEAVALMHSELSEALEAMRKGNPESVNIPGHPQVAEELADVIVRILDWAGGKGLDIGAAMVAKMEYNAGRPHRHGKKF